MTKFIALVGDYNKDKVSHNAIPIALKLASQTIAEEISWEWIDTTKISGNASNILGEFSGIWVVPGSPYKNMEGAISAIRFARETNRPFLGTCGGFQHALIEYARNIYGADNADHEETNPTASTLVITVLPCSLVDQSEQIFFTPDSRLDSIYGEHPATEDYQCNYGLNPDWKNKLESVGIQFAGLNKSGEIRAFELPTQPFFIGTLFQPERSALKNKPHPLIMAFVKAISIS